jgi:uncharacterized protein (TIGR03067 family)
MTCTLVRRFGLSLIVAALAAGSASAQDEKDQVKGPLRRMQGTWTFTTSNGNEGKMVFDRDTARAEFDGETYVAKVTTDRRAEPHPTIDFAITEAPNDSVGETARGIFRFDGARKLTLCIASPGQPRPTEFKAEGDDVRLFELTKKE